MRNTPKTHARDVLGIAGTWGFDFNHMPHTLQRFVGRTLDNVADKLTTREIEYLTQAIQHIRLAAEKKAAHGTL